MNDDYYKILGVSPSSSLQQIKRRYHLLAKQYHPDRNPNSTEFNAIAEAYSVLEDPHKRILYNLYGKNAVNVAEYINIPITQKPLSKQNRMIMLFISLILILLEHILQLPLIIISSTICHIYLTKQIPWKTIVVVLIISSIYSLLQYFYQFETGIVDHIFIYSELVLIINDGHTLSWDYSFIVWIFLCFLSYIHPIHSPLCIGSFNIAIGAILTTSCFMRVCASDDTNSHFFRNATHIMYAVPDLQYGLLVLFAFWFFHGIVDSLIGSSLEYVTISIQFFPLNSQPISYIIVFVTFILSLVVYKFLPPILVYFFSSAVVHFLIASLCIRVAGPSIKNALIHKTPKKIRFGGPYIIRDCTDIGPPQMTFADLCKDVSVRQPIEWEIEKSDSRWKVLVGISIFTYLMELLFCSINTNMHFFRSVTIGYGLSVAMFGFGEILEMHHKL
ncbi:chaperone protein DNAj, putative [Entamoeba dispar SAW760]|uniref:Chaperone protein DNAj, putative n=1 Tax=Entamoeba dispar (strain ATCC PRA-260 / SAW760) TaxID=370354 RepID=B0ET39_ENTDS|nr:chaperone protein DNAj, putative [Entamoeba dispar SAW760]EDR22292.1 chaperone protein DNAj, putative [Entamoeba dispar SAW760]|eukprot:EDR22292.1 chaperone protein DNAj, putative [Entamoeba dispar SAW760]